MIHVKRITTLDPLYEEERDLRNVVLYPIESGLAKAQLMQMAIHPDYQRMGIGRLLINDLITFAKQEGIEEVICHSRKNVNTFYQKIGFKIYGQPFEEVGIQHNHMKIIL